VRETVRLLDEDLVALVHAHHARGRDLGGDRVSSLSRDA
jgi:hypothetical protein